MTPQLLALYNSWPQNVWVAYFSFPMLAADDQPELDDRSAYLHLFASKRNAAALSHLVGQSRRLVEGIRLGVKDYEGLQVGLSVHPG